MMHGVGSMDVQQHANLVQTNTSATTKQQQQRERIRRPINAYILWHRSQRLKFSTEHPKMHRFEISKHLGAKWKLLTADEKNIFIDEAKLLKEQHMRDHPDYKCRYRRKPKPAMNPTEPEMPCASPYFQPGIGARTFTANPQSYDIDNRPNVVANHIAPYVMHLATYPASYTEIHRVAIISNSYQLRPASTKVLPPGHPHYKLLCSNRYRSAFARDAINRSEFVHSNASSCTPLLQRISPQNSQKEMSPPNRQQMIPHPPSQHRYSPNSHRSTNTPLDLSLGGVGPTSSSRK